MRTISGFEAGIDVEFQDGDEVTGAPEKLLEWVKGIKAERDKLRRALHQNNSSALVD